jgi:hypothetical protein
MLSLKIKDGNWSDSDNTFYRIFNQIRIQIQMFLNMNSKQMFWIEKQIQIFNRFGRQHLQIIKSRKY